MQKAIIFMRKIFTLLFLVSSILLMAQTGDITKEFQYPNFVKYHQNAKDNMANNLPIKAERSVKAARHAAKYLIKKGFENEIKLQLNELDGIITKIESGAATVSDVKATMIEISFWESQFRTLYTAPENYALKTLPDVKKATENGRRNIKPFNSHRVLSLIENMKTTPAYLSAMPSSSTKKPKRVGKQRKIKNTSAKGSVDRNKVDNLESFIKDIEGNLLKYNAKEIIGKTLSSIKTTTSDGSTWDIKYLRAFVNILLKLDSQNSYALTLQQKLNELPSIPSLKIENNKRFAIPTENFNVLPTSVQKNKALDEKIIATVAGHIIGAKNVIFIDKDWKIEKDNSGNTFLRSMNIWLTSLPSNSPHGFVNKMTIVQYFSGANYGEICIDKYSIRKSASHKIIDELYAKSGKTKLPTALVTDVALSQKMMAAASKKESNDFFVTGAIISTKSWGTNKDSNGRTISRSRMAAITYKNASNECFFAYFLFKQNYKSGNYGTTFIQKNLSRKILFSCSQAK